VASLKGDKKVLEQLRIVSDKLSKANEVEVGFLPDAKYPDGTQVAQVAFWNEFGTERIPPRPFFRNMIAAKSPEWGPALGGLIVKNGYDAEKALAQAGQAIAGQLRESILNTNTPPSAASTIAAKMRGSSKSTAKAHGILGPEKPLVDTGVMLSKIDSVVL
jgi:hypothetical protein